MHVLQGTLTHMAPELLLAGWASTASDVYAYGILLWELATGQRAFAGAFGCIACSTPGLYTCSRQKVNLAGGFRTQKGIMPVASWHPVPGSSANNLLLLC